MDGLSEARSRRCPAGNPVTKARELSKRWAKLNADERAEYVTPEYAEWKASKERWAKIETKEEVVLERC